MTRKNSWLCCALLLLSLICNAQQKFSRLTSETGLNFQRILEQRFTANAVQYIGFQTRTGFEFGRANKWNRIELSFAKNFKKVQGISSYINLNPAIKYTHLRKIKKGGLSLGGAIDYGNLLIFPESSDFENNPIAYTFWVSLNAAAKWQKPVRLGKQSINLSIMGDFPLLAYVIRPAFAHPYPTNYLEEGIFDFDRTDMGKYLVKSGKVSAINQFVHTQLKTTLGLPFGQKAHEIGLTYLWDFIRVGGAKTVWQAQQQFSLYLKINLHAK